MNAQFRLNLPKFDEFSFESSPTIKPVISARRCLQAGSAQLQKGQRREASDCHLLWGSGMNRRTFLKFTTAAATGVLAAPYVHAQSKKFAGITLRVNGWGGRWDAAIMKGVASPLEEKYGLKVQMAVGTQVAQFVKLIAEKQNPSFDLFIGDSSVMVELIEAGVIEEIKASDVPNIKRILPGFHEFGDHGVPFCLSAIGPAYNPKFIKQPLTSYSDMARPDLKSRVVLYSPATNTSSLYLLGWAEENGGSISNMEPAFKILEAAKPNIVALVQSQTPLMQTYQSEEAYAAIVWSGAAYELNSKGIPMVFNVPPRGIYAATTYCNLVKGMKYPEAAHAFAEQLLSDQGMLAIPEASRYDVTTDVKLPEELRKDLLFTSPERVALKKNVDWKKWTEGRSARIERFNKIIRI
ncbi:extracellular solute-binding protein [Bradyrhizobium huanghuaihaiense]|uniref:ABC transporter substrate-binding protein n=1 Tax=Bradyrhizobium huanghuaihaiense TaxID=990078 RepID=UPI0021AA562A|nr:extracellular solute-binding protein [Bradyrhizobium sp. CB3035]UWU75841.1 extracellular solute-binding protein [Bradyrhizobium sp. CB3035]